MRGITLTPEELKEDLKEKAPSYYTDERLVSMTYADLIYAVQEVNKAVDSGETDIYAPGEEAPVPVVEEVEEPEAPNFIRHPRFGILKEEEVSDYEAAESSDPDVISLVKKPAKKTAAKKTAAKKTAAGSK